MREKVGEKVRERVELTAVSKVHERVEKWVVGKGNLKVLQSAVGWAAPTAVQMELYWAAQKAKEWVVERDELWAVSTADPTAYCSVTYSAVS